MRSDVISVFADNPYVTCLPSFPDKESIYSEMMRVQKSTDEERRLEPYMRKQLLGNLDEFLIPPRNCYQLAETLDRMILESYRYRNPNDHTDERYLNTLRPVRTAPACTIIGPSGCGKTTMINHLLARYPQVIEHKDENSPFKSLQIVWLKVDIDSGSGPKPFFLDILREVDRLTGSDLALQYSGPKVRQDVLRVAVERALAVNHVGLLVIDEAQNFFRAYNKDLIVLADELTSLLNRLETAVVFCGTEETLQFFNGPLYGGRRMTTFGQYEVAPIQKKKWHSYMEKLWNYQYTSDPTPLTEKLEELFYNTSRGIMGVAKTIYALTQDALIGRDSEIITPNAVNAVVSQHLSGVSMKLKGF